MPVSDQQGHRRHHFTDGPYYPAHPKPRRTGSIQLELNELIRAQNISFYKEPEQRHEGLRKLGRP